MVNTQYSTIEKLKNGVDGYKIKVRVIRLWRGSTKDGEEFKNFNTVLINQKGQRIHAFVPTKCAEEFQYQLHLGRVFSINHFDVQLYKQSDKYRMLRNPTQLVFSNDTKIQELVDDGVTIPLDDVVGIIKDYGNIRDLRNKHGKDQKQAKFIITDGNLNINVTFWDKFGENFDKQMKTPLDQPVIIIISGCKVGKWNGQIDISNNNATRIYLNYKHHSVTKLRKLLTNPEFEKKFWERQKRSKWQCLLCPTSPSWEKKISRFRIHVVAEDKSGQMQVVLGDREVRTIIGRRPSVLADEIFSVQGIPKCLLAIVDKEYSLVIQIKEINIVKSFKFYWATNICTGFVSLPVIPTDGASSSQAQTSQASPGIRSLENRHECDAGPGVAKMLVLYEVVAFACFLLSSLVAKVLKLLFRLDGKQIRLFIRQGFGVKDALLLLTVFSSVTGIILLTLSVVNVVQIRIGLYSSGSAEARMAIWALCTIVAIALVIYVVSISVAIYASIIGDADIDPVLGQHHSSNRGNNNSADTDVAVQVRGLTQKKDDLVSRS
ncbi:hypothetical protein ACET3Z_013553 [Daucus carota]